MTILIRFSNVSKKFGTKSLVDNISFIIKKGDLTTIIGPNGAGKTTIAKLILGLEKPSSGNVNSSSKLRIGYVPQTLDFDKSLPMSATKFLALLAPNVDKEKDAHLLRFADFDNIKSEDISVLSGGQLQKLFLVATLLNRPNLIILDEPIKSLDVVSQQAFYQIIERVKIEYKLTIVMISHDLFTVMKNSDQVICVNHHICCSGHPNDMMHNEDFLKTLSAIGFYAHHHDHDH